MIQVYGGTFAMRRSSVDGNSATVVAATADDTLTSGTAIEVDGDATISDSSISRNTASSVGTAGSAWISNGLGVFGFDGSQGTTVLRRVVISGNTATATSSTADAHVLGVGVLNNSELTIADSVIAKNRGSAISSDGTAQGAGIWNGAFLSGPPVDLTVTRTLVTGNALRGGVAQGGGVYNDGGDAVTASLAPSAVVQGNAPDQVYDASTAVSAQRLRISPRRAAMSR